MHIVSATDERVIADMGITYLTYTFLQKYSRYDELRTNIDKLVQFTTETENVPSIYDVKTHTFEGEESISFTSEKPRPPLTKDYPELTVADCKDIIIQVCDIVETARELDIFHMDIGFHTVGYDLKDETVYIIDWYDSVLQVPTNPPFYISESPPPELQQNKPSVHRNTLTRAENYQICCFAVNLLNTVQPGITAPQVLQHGSSSEMDERPTLEVIKQSIRQM